jgi:hypothetical protein
MSLMLRSFSSTLRRVWTPTARSADGGCMEGIEWTAYNTAGDKNIWKADLSLSVQA